MANILVENIMEGCNDEDNKYLLIKSILDYRTNDNSIKKKDEIHFTQTEQK